MAKKLEEMEGVSAQAAEKTEDGKSVEEVFQELEEIAKVLEDPQTTLEDSFRKYQQGMELLKYCSSRLDLVEKKMLQLNEDGAFREFP